MTAALQPFDRFTISEATALTHCVTSFRVKPEEAKVDVPGSSFCVVLKTNEEQSRSKPYTPCGFDSNSMTLIIKKYDTNGVADWIHTKSVGDSIYISRPLVKFHYEPGRYTKVGMLAGGTGICPMYQIIARIAENADDKTEARLLASFSFAKDIFLKEDLEGFCQKKPGQIKVDWVVSRDDPNWTGGRCGRIDENLISSTMPKPSENGVLILVCGTKQFHEDISGGNKEPLGGILKRLGYTDEQVFRF